MTRNQKAANDRLLKITEELSRQFWKALKIYQKPTMTAGVALSFPKLDKAIKLHKKHFN